MRACGGRPDDFSQEGDWIVVQPQRYRYAVCETDGIHEKAGQWHGGGAGWTNTQSYANTQSDADAQSDANSNTYSDADANAADGRDS